MNSYGAVPEVIINGMHEIDPIEVIKPGAPSPSEQGENGESYTNEYDICKDRAEKAKAAQQSRKYGCWAYVDADLANADNNYLKDISGSSAQYEAAVALRKCNQHPAKWDPEEVYESCLESCAGGGSASKNDANGGGSPDCFDDFYSVMGGRTPNEWSDAGCSCGNKDASYFGCNFKFLVNLVPQQY